jgi:hypothetical protein
LLEYREFARYRSAGGWLRFPRLFTTELVSTELSGG